LILQILVFGTLLLWLDGTVFPAILRQSKTTKVQEYADREKIAAGASGRPDVDAETARVETSEDDLLRMLHVTKQFGSSIAVDNVSLGLQAGEVLALLGPNGAGKSTSINMIRGDLAPTSGRIFLRGMDVATDPRLAHQHLGVCPQFDALDKLTVREHLRFYAHCKRVGDIDADVAHVIARVGLGAHTRKMAAKLSGGNKRKLSLAIALLGNPPVLLLDEPSSAMDAVSKRVLWRILRAVAPGRSILITTHSMEEADALATRAAILARRLLAVGTTQNLRRRHSNEYHVHLVLRSAPVSTPAQMEGVARWVRETFPSAEFEGQNLGGQVRFIVTADGAGSSDTAISDSDVAVSGHAVSRASNSAGYLIETLEANKEALDLECYSIGAATMERVFLSVVKESDAEDIEEEGVKSKWRWW
jgi:ATP-binding cassette, subfamily A (ABC1), member 3